MATSASRLFDHVLIFMLENEYRSYVLRNPFMKQLAGQGIELTNSCGVMHPSQTNYIASIAGELCNVTYDDPVIENGGLRKQRTIVDLIEEAGLTWKAYMQSDPGQQWTPDLIPQDDYPYLAKHNPFSSFENIVRDPKRWNCIVDEYQFWADVINGDLPNYAWFTPNMWNDGHYVAGTQLPAKERAPQLVDQAAAWLQTLFAALQFPGPNSKLPARTLVVVTFDEADYEKDYKKSQEDASSYDGPNQVYTVLLGVPAGAAQAGYYNHYSLLKTIERNFGLGSLGKNDAGCNSYDFLWNQSFQWGTPVVTSVTTEGPLAAAAFAERLYVVSVGSQGQLQCQFWDGRVWSTAVGVGASCSGGIAVAAVNDQLMLVFQSADQSLCAMSYSLQAGWTQSPQTIVGAAVGTFAVTALDTGRLMLAYQDSGNQIQSLLYANGAWSATPVAVGQQTDGTITLAMLGPSLYLVAKVVGQDGMNVVSYNTAEFNVVTITKSATNGPNNNSTREVWSPSAFPVAQFGVEPLREAIIGALTSGSEASSSGSESNSTSTEAGSKSTGSSSKSTGSGKSSKPPLLEPEPAWQPHTAGGPLAAAELAGAIHLVHPAVGATPVSEETFSTSGILTPRCLVSYTKSKSDDTTAASTSTTATPTSTTAAPTSDGFGTLAQAGWGDATQIPEVQQDSTRGLAIARLNFQLILLFQPDTSGQVKMITGTIE